MPPKRDIRDFFKAKPQTSVSPGHPPKDYTDSLSALTPDESNKSIISASASSSLSTSYAACERTSIVDEVAQPLPSRVPSTSQSSLRSTGSKRKILDTGELMILDSDSGSSSDELEELDLSLFRKAARSRDVPIVSKPAARPQRASVRRPAGYSRAQDHELRKPSDNHRTGKPNMNRLVQAAQSNLALEQMIAAGKAELDKPLEEAPSAEVELSEETLASLAGQGADDEKSKRLYKAMQRTNTHDASYVFHFFDSDDSNLQRSNPRPFPSDCLPAHGWSAIFEEPWSRQQAFLSNFALRTFQYHELPPELVSWMIDQLTTSEDDSLNAKYLQVLEEYPIHLPKLLGTQQLNSLFKNLGADVESLSLPQAITPSYESREEAPRPLSPALSWVLRLLRVSAKWLSPKTSSHALLILIHLCFDDTVMSNATLLTDVQMAIESIMGSIVELTPLLRDLVPTLLHRITNPTLQNNCILSLPSHSPLTASFRQHLALAFLLHPLPMNVPLPSPDMSDLILDHIDNSTSFVATRDTDYTELTARISLLDVGIGPGLTEVPYPRPPEPDSPPEKVLIPKRVALTSEEVKFNQQIDILAQHIKYMSNRILETGALGDPARSDAKSSAERLCHRLENAVRIGGLKKRDIFGNAEADGSKEIISRFFTRIQGSRSATPSTPASMNDDDSS